MSPCAVRRILRGQKWWCSLPVRFAPTKYLIIFLTPDDEGMWKAERWYHIATPQRHHAITSFGVLFLSRSSDFRTIGLGHSPSTQKSAVHKQATTLCHRLLAFGVASFRGAPTNGANRCKVQLTAAVRLASAPNTHAMLAVHAYVVVRIALLQLRLQ